MEPNKITRSSVQEATANDSDTVLWAGIAVAIGAIGVIVTSTFYALSPAAAALPMPNPSLANALNGMIAGRSTIQAAGTTGILFDVIMAGGTLVLMVFRKPASLQIERMGWALVTICILIFVVVDSLAAGVLTQIASLDSATVAFAGFKLLYDTLFVLGTIAFGLGATFILVSELKSQSPVLAKPLLWVGIFVACSGFMSGLFYFADLSFPKVIGISIAGGSLIFAIYGIQIARSTRQAIL